MRNKVLFLCMTFFSVVGAELQAAPIEQVTSFSFDHPFEYYSRPDMDQISGMSDMLFPGPGYCFVAGTFDQKYFLFDRTWKEIAGTPEGFGYVFHAQSSHYVLLGKKPGTELRTLMWIYDKREPTKLLYSIDQGSYSGNSVYVAGNAVFFDSNQGFVVWELLGDGKTKFYDPDEARTWLSAGNAERFGYSRDVRTHFGTNVLGSSMGEPYAQQADFSKGRPLGFVPGKTEMYEIGRDRMGLAYFFSVGPDENKLPTLTTGYYYFGIVDPWGKKVAFRSLGTGRGVSPNQTQDYFGRTGLPRAVDPSGNIYFFDVDVTGKRFVLSRMINDWWDELGVKNRLVGVVNDNRVRLRNRASTDGAILGYLYENEMALITETSDKQETISGMTAPWYKVSLPDGRSGWVFGGLLNVNK